MTVQTLTAFFMWCSIINGGLLALWTMMCIAAPELVYRTQSRWFPIPRDTFRVIIYLFLGMFKIAFIVLNLTPWLVLLIID